MQRNTEISKQPFQIPPGKKVFFASDFHLGSPDYQSSRQREAKIIHWLETIRKEAAMLFLLGDQFDFWFEYKHTIPKGYIRFLGKLAELKDQGLPIYFFTGNHDMWMFDYFEKELDIPVIRHPVTVTLNETRLYIGHGDGLGPADRTYKLLKKMFQSRTCQWLFGRIHPDLGLGLAHYWSKSSRIKNMKKDESFKGKEKEWIYLHCLEVEKRQHHDYYVFGHRHLPLSIPLHEHSQYINIGEWITQYTYGIFDGKKLSIESFKDEA